MTRRWPVRLLVVTSGASAGASAGAAAGAAAGGSARSRTADFAVAAGSTFAELAPILAGELGLATPAGATGTWRLWHEDRLLEAGDTPQSAGLLDGDGLHLTHVSAEPGQHG